MPSNKICKFYLCPSRSKKHPQKKFFPFVKPWMDLDRCLRWISATGRKDLTTVFIDKNSYVCEDHFVSGAPSAENPDPFPMFVAVRASQTKPHDKEIGGNPDTSIVNPLEEQGTHDNSGVCRGYLVKGVTSTENSNLLTHHFLAGIGDDEKNDFPPSNYSCLANTLSPERQAAQSPKKKALARRKTSRLNQKPYKVPLSNSKVTDADETVPHGCLGPLTEDVPSTVEVSDVVRQFGKACASVPPESNSNTAQLANTGSNPMVPKDNVCKHYQRICVCLQCSDVTMVSIDNESHANVEISPLVGNSCQDTYVGSRDVRGVIEKDGKCSVATQTCSRGCMQLLAADKLSTRKSTLEGQFVRVERSDNHDKNVGNRVQNNENDGGKRLKVITINSRGRITILEREKVDDND